MVDRRHARLLALCRIKGVDWHLIAREAQRPEGLDRLLCGELTEQTRTTDDMRALLAAGLPMLEEHVEAVLSEVGRAQDVGARLLTVLDEDYPRTLRLIFNLPPFLFVRGEIRDEDLRSVAVVGTRQPSDLGLSRAAMMASRLTDRGVTVVSGLARGIDTAAHTATLETGGRTIAVIGNGITGCYPKENAELAEAIALHGAIVSQFWPSAPPTSYSFPKRNITMSGIAQGTVVIEASATSGAKMQARLALEHGKKVFLLRSLVEDHEWAAKYADKRGAFVVDDIEDVIKNLAAPAAIHDAEARRVQLSLEFA